MKNFSILIEDGERKLKNWELDKIFFRYSLKQALFFIEKIKAIQLP